MNDIERPEEAARQSDKVGSEADPEPVELPPEADDTSEAPKFNSVQLNHHASRVIAALYSLSKRLDGPEFEFILTKLAIDLAKRKVLSTRMSRPFSQRR
jgi:hypothetical protein